MRRIFAFLSCLITMPAVAFDDACTKPGEFTVDRRCYVTDEQKTQKPFNAVVALVDGKDPYCTGTIVKHEDKLYVYTAKHCADKKSHKMKQSLRVQTQDGQNFRINYLRSGDDNYKDTKSKKTVNINQDWALYSLDDTTEEVSYTKISDEDRSVQDGWVNSVDVSVIGYGSMGILSDAELDEFKQKYLDFARSKGAKEEELEKTKNNGGILSNLSGPTAFITHLQYRDKKYYNHIFNDTELKVSYCKSTFNTFLDDCQGWGGNSGGGVFDSDGNLTAVVSQGLPDITGEHHAEITEASPIRRRYEEKPVGF